MTAWPLPDYKGSFDLKKIDNARFTYALPRHHPLVGRTARETSHQQLNALGNFLVASSAAVPARLAVHPLSVIRACAGVGVPGHKTGPAQSIIWLWRIEGFSSYIKAIQPSVIKSFPQIGLQFGIYDALSKQLVPDVPHKRITILSSMATFICGGIAGATAQAILHPLDVVKTRLCVQGILTPHVYKGMMDCAQKIISNYGALGLYRGVVPSVAGAYVYCGTMFAGWDFMNRLPWRRNGTELYWFERHIDLYMALCAATFVSLPLDVVRRKMMAFDPTLPKNGRVDVVADTLVNTIKNTFLDAGVPGFFRGFFASCIKAAPQAVVFYFAFKATQMSMVGVFGSKDKQK